MNLTPSERGEHEFKHILKLETFFSLNGRNNSPKIENFDRKRGFGKPEILCFPPFLSPFPYFLGSQGQRKRKKTCKISLFRSKFPIFGELLPPFKENYISSFNICLNSRSPLSDGVKFMFVVRCPDSFIDF